ncbi:Fe-S cluster assembly protein SufD [Glycomyces niveus]|uniref:Fe-S cluster assembly protein SufD n=1 Tax=Glycomyces niveus TaxID=2820287 RepID=A0ABS3U3C1_9ACTN|nr:Fe-S cluster assembly protein SufD [Glycomyces sp. NEAU-S30]MBO3733235.1 Fe-S cluster assembly protein SufD [Glycomyces sp. NEAU-S30]
MSIELATGTKPHTHGLGEVPPKTKSQLLRSFEPADFPALTGREEDWRYTPVKRLAGLDDTETAPAAKAAEYAIRSLPAGVTAEAVGKDDKRLGSILTPFDRPSAVAWAKTEKALLVSVAPETQVAEPVWLDVTGGGLDGATWAHTYIEVGHHADVTLIVRHTGLARLGDNVEISVGDGAHLRLVAVAEWDREATHVEHQKARLGRDAKLDHIAVTLGGDLVRQYLSVDYAGRGGSVDAFGLYFADAEQHLEHRQLVDHSVPDCHSNVNYRGALQGDTARTVWVGDVLIQDAATGTDTYEINRNLVLSDGARAISVPNLEIETGEIVGAGHASATGRFDEEHLFYLQSRGIPEAEARRLVVKGFFNEIIQKIPDEDLREELTELVVARLDAGKFLAPEDIEAGATA